MITVKFRGKTIDDGLWVCGTYAVKNLHWIVTPFKGGDGKTYYRNHEVDPETVGQYINYKSKSDIEIYTDDIIKRPNGEIGVVIVDQACYTLKYPFGSKHDYISWPSEYFDECDLIGNKHDTPELMPK